ncbi:ketopantoate reductase family protein [bacterium endosymbiont of Pedicinus badii]|uniref:ketopantoate reductase family protein n=1 Tax=bacterium endosymbiont of Pedicinus badii TaxID=1719126 RepID=UPI0009B9B6BD|nr:2-dehydropantoate 2-reductase [bacterium endosymbiont of Pedicinus badii]OQM34291.1 hypothetical protein AOQ89_00105 [bacterium endosymbiont of Pedicinus badii]
MKSMKATVVGCGAIGKFLMILLSKKSIFVQGWTKKREKFLKFFFTEKSFVFQINNKKHLKNSKIVFFCTKAQDSHLAILNIIKYIKKSAFIFLLSNGLGIVEKISRIKNPIVLGFTTHSVTELHKNTIKVNYFGEFNIGPSTKMKKEQERLIIRINQKYLNFIWHKNIQIPIWKKFTANCVINPLTVLYNCKNGKLIKFKKKISKICKEIFNLIKAQNISIKYKNLFFYVIQIIEYTKENTSSMLQDIKKNKKSEIDYLNGYVLKISKKYHFSCPNNEKIFKKIKKIEKKIKIKNRNF